MLIERGVALTIVSTLLLVALPQNGRADSTAPSDVLVAVYALQPDMEIFRGVIVDAIRYRLSNSGLSVDFQPASPEGANLETQARKSGEPIALSCRYGAAGGRLSVSLEWRDLQRGGTPVVSEQSGALNLSADSVILRAIDLLISAVADRISQLATVRAAHVPPAGGTTTTAPAGPEVPPAPTRSTRRFVLSAGFAPFIAIGPASYYFSVGLLPSILASLEFSTTAGRFAIGLYAAADIFSATGLIDSSSNVLIPIGPDLRYSLGDGAFLLFAHISGGPALLLMNTVSQGMLMDITGFVKSGIGATVMITSWMGISVSADYEVYFEMPYLIMGFSPTALMTLKL